MICASSSKFPCLRRSCERMSLNPMQNQAIAVIWPSLSRIVAISHDARRGLNQGRQDDAVNDSAPPGRGEHKEQALLCVPGTRSCHSEGMSNRYLKNWVSLAQRIAVGRA